MRRPDACALTTRPGGEVVPFEPGPVVTMYTCGITPYDATHLGHAAVVPHLRRAAAPPARPRPRHPLRAQRHRRRRLDPAAQGPRARRPLPRPGRGRDGPLRRRHGARSACSRSWSEPRATSAIADIRGFIGMVLDRGHAYQAGGAVYFDVVVVRRGSARSSHFDRERDARPRRRARRQRRRPAQARPARLRALAAVGSTTSRRGSRCGARAGRAGTSSARRWPCASSAPRSTCTAAAPT